MGLVVSNFHFLIFLGVSRIINKYWGGNVNDLFYLAPDSYELPFQFCDGIASKNAYLSKVTSFGRLATLVVNISSGIPVYSPKSGYPSLVDRAYWTPPPLLAHTYPPPTPPYPPPQTQNLASGKYIYQCSHLRGCSRNQRNILQDGLVMLSLAARDHWKCKEFNTFRGCGGRGRP